MKSVKFMLDQWNQLVVSFISRIFFSKRGPTNLFAYPQPIWHTPGNEGSEKRRPNQPYGDLTHFTEIAKYRSEFWNSNEKERERESGKKCSFFGCAWCFIKQYISTIFHVLNESNKWLFNVLLHNSW